MFGRRPDATLVRELSAVRQFMPFISPRRNESVVYFEHTLDAEYALAYLEQLNADRPPERRITFFHLVLHGLAVAVFHERPRLNRFVAGGRLWQRDGIWLSFSAKRAFDDESPILTVKQRIDPNQSLGEMVDAIYEKLGAGRAGKKTTSDTEVDLLLKLPVPVVRALMWLVEKADALGLLPAAMIHSDPLYASAFVANLGSVGLDAGYHHLWEHGNCPIFCVIGRIAPDESGRQRVTLKYTYDERVEDGLYCARTLERLRERLEHPEKL
jgi:hypothetical protein